MKLTKNIKLSLKALLLNRSRTNFAIIGLFIGITTVIVIVSIGNGAKKKITEQFEKMRSDMIAINSGKMSKVAGRQRQINLVATLTLKDVNAMAEECLSVEKVVPTKFSLVREIAERVVEQNNQLIQKLESLIGEGVLLV